MNWWSERERKNTPLDRYQTATCPNGTAPTTTIGGTRTTAVSARQCVRDAKHRYHQYREQCNDRERDDEGDGERVGDEDGQ